GRTARRTAEPRRTLQSMPPTLLNAILDDAGKQWIAIGVALFLIVYFVIRPMGKRKQDPLGKMSTPGQSMSSQRSVEREMSNLLVELSEMARQVTAQLDTRSTKLELLMREADEKIEALRALQSSAPASPPPSTAPVQRQIVTEREALMQPLEPSPPPPQEQQIDPRHAEIYALADQGRTPVDIASHLGRPSGEIELILALRQ
ncbi:MAG: hypothetical protein M3478_07025, partial [Planctomycetota bacterium]|nr:hypothetical protein [Planctomycetota bacterium]